MLLFPATEKHLLVLVYKLCCHRQKEKRKPPTSVQYSQHYNLSKKMHPRTTKRQSCDRQKPIQQRTKLHAQPLSSPFSSTTDVHSDTPSLLKQMPSQKLDVTVCSWWGDKQMRGGKKAFTFFFFTFSQHYSVLEQKFVHSNSMKKCQTRQAITALQSTPPK